MPDENERFWKENKGKLRRSFNLDPICREEAEAELKRHKNNKPMAEGDIDSIMEFVRSWGANGGLAAEPEPEAGDDAEAPSAWVDPVTPEMMDEQILLLNSNAGDKDDETEDLIEKLRREALDNDSTNDEDATGLGNAEDPSGTGR